MIKDHLKELRRSSTPQMMFGPQCGDAHQDRRLLAELLPTEFRDHLVLWLRDPQMGNRYPRPTIFLLPGRDVAEEKARLLLKHYPSQTSHDGFGEQAFLGLARYRGAQCHNPYAEGFVLERAIVTFERC
jgi:hypothetical protein